ncbi:MAG: hypothetical protein K1Y36_21645 [Blastocatellia bacterium]|nr:hypothetical protein [Blastocatellia bacterium]
MMAQKKRPAFDHVSADLLAQAEMWSPELFCGEGANVYRASARPGNVSLKKLGGKCFEGWRRNIFFDGITTDELPPDVPLYRQFNLDEFLLHPGPEHWETPKLEESWCVQPGDIVINRMPPVYATWITPSVHRHPVDANCLIVRGLNQGDGFWLTLVLNQEAYIAYLTAGSGTVHQRVNVGKLKELRIPAVPGEIRQLAVQVWDCLDAITSLAEATYRLREDVAENVAGYFSEFDWMGSDFEAQLRNGTFFPAPAIDESLKPQHVALGAWHHLLRRKLGWVSLAEVTIGPQSQPRLGTAPNKKISFLRLGDADDEFGFNEAELTHSVQQLTRVFRQPLQANEVLLSTLVTNPRVVFADHIPTATIHPVDQWERFTFLETPGGWALVLATPPIQQQISMLAQGSVQQFASAGSYYRILVPPIPFELRRKWDHRLREHRARKRELVADWKKLRAEGQRLFEIWFNG